VNSIAYGSSLRNTIIYLGGGDVCSCKIENDRVSGPDGLNVKLLKVDKMSHIFRLWKQ
jgi:hypothetical protein